MNFFKRALVGATLLIAISYCDAAATFSGFPGLTEGGDVNKRDTGAAPAVPQPRTLSPIVGGTCKIVCDGIYQKYSLNTMKTILPCDSACKVVDLMAEGMTEAFVIAISGPEKV